MLLLQWIAHPNVKILHVNREFYLMLIGFRNNTWKDTITSGSGKLSFVKEIPFKSLLCLLIPFKGTHTHIWSKNIFSCRELIVCKGCRGEFPTDGKLAMIGGLTTNHLIVWSRDFVCFKMQSFLVETCRLSLGSHHHWQIQDFPDKGDGGWGARTYYLVKFLQKTPLMDPRFFLKIKFQTYKYGTKFLPHGFPCAILFSVTFLYPRQQ